MRPIYSVHFDIYVYSCAVVTMTYQKGSRFTPGPMHGTTPILARNVNSEAFYSYYVLQSRCTAASRSVSRRERPFEGKSDLGAGCRILGGERPDRCFNGRALGCRKVVKGAANVTGVEPVLSAGLRHDANNTSHCAPRSSSPPSSSV